MKNLRLLALAAVSAAALAGCAPTHNVRGNLLEDFQIADVAVGIDTESEVMRKLGSPTTKAPFDDTVWYYLGQQTEKKGILDPQVTGERIVVVFFSSAGIVEEIKDIPPGRVDLPLVRRKTPTSGNEVTIMEQFLGNLGRFNKAEGAAEE